MKNADGTQPKISLWLLLRRTFPPFLKAVPLFLAGWTLISILHGLSWGVETLVNAHLFDAVAEAVTGNQGLTAVLGMLAVLGIVTLMTLMYCPEMFSIDLLWNMGSPNPILTPYSLSLIHI